MNINKLNRAIIYVDRLSRGCNPINNVRIPDDSVLNDPNIIRCMFYLKETLKEIYYCNVPKKSFPYDVLKNYVYEEDKTITKVFNQINGLVDLKTTEKVKMTKLLKWLKTNGYLVREETFGYDGMTTIVTEKGKELGMYNQIRILDTGRKYMAVLYNRKAQMFIVDNIENINNTL